MTVVEVTTHQQFLSLLAASNGKLLIIDFKAEWCGPCKAIAPVYHDLSNQYLDITFASLDVDAVKESAQMAGVTAMPTFQFYKGGKKIHEMKGANKAGLETIIKKLSEQASSSTEGTKSLIPGQIDLQPFISNQLECLNFDAAHPMKNIFSEGESVLKSDVDEQLILAIAFNQPVKVHSLKFIGGGNGPKSIKTFVNRSSTLSFDDADSEVSIDSFELSPEDLQSETLPKALRYVKYQYVHHLTIFIGDNQDGSDVTSLKRLIIYGNPIDATKDVSELKKVDDHDH